MRANQRYLSLDIFEVSTVAFIFFWSIACRFEKNLHQGIMQIM
jgi:hypothetical protein